MAAQKLNCGWKGAFFEHVTRVANCPLSGAPLRPARCAHRTPRCASAARFNREKGRFVLMRFLYDRGREDLFPAPLVTAPRLPVNW